jgi:hypothetical protein
MKPNKSEPTEKMLGSIETKLSFQPTRIVSHPGEYILHTGVSLVHWQGESAAFTDVTLVKKDGRPRRRHNISPKAVHPFFRKGLRVNRHCQHVIYSVGP